jgi:regulator of sirC expression with transglutaminase-like and TPR domain
LIDFAAFAALREERMDVLTGALLIAKDEYAGLDIARERARVDDIAAPLGILERCDAETQAAKLAEHLFSTLGFRGNADEYYDPRNSFMNDVLDRRLGIPISLSLLYTEVARRTGVPASGVGFPGHFLVRIERESSDPLIIDPFISGRVVGRPTLESMLPNGVRFDRSMIAAARPRAILQRMLANLKGIYATRGELSRLLVVLSRLLELDPGLTDDRRDRGIIAMRLGSKDVAESDLRKYLELAPQAGDAAEVRRILSRLEGRPSRSN